MCSKIIENIAKANGTTDSFFKIEVKASAGCAVCSKILANIAHENGYDDEQGNRVPNFDVTTWHSIGCGALFKSRTKSGKRRMACVLRIKQGGKEINIPSIVPPPDVLHALNKWMSLPKDWEMQTPRMLQEATIPMFPTTWKCGPPYDFIGRFQTGDWIKRGKPYVSEKGWSNILMIALRGVSPNLSLEEAEKMDSIIKTADDLEKESTTARRGSRRGSRQRAPHGRGPHSRGKMHCTRQRSA